MIAGGGAGPHHLHGRDGLFDPTRSPSGQRPSPAVALAEVLARDFAISEVVRHDGSGRTARSRTGGWLLPDGPDRWRQASFVEVIPVVLERIDRMVTLTEETSRMGVALRRARVAFAEGGAYALRVLSALRAQPGIVFDGGELADAWLARALPSGTVVSQPTLWGLYRDAGSPGGLDQRALNRLADARFGKPRSSRVDGPVRKAYRVP